MKLQKEDLAVIEVTSPDPMGWNLDCIYIDPQRIIATDGKALVIREIPMEPGERIFNSYLVRAEDVRRSIGKQGNISAGDNGTAQVRSTNGGAEKQQIAKRDGGYPDVEDVLPPLFRDGQNSIILDRELLIRLLKAFEGVDKIALSVAGPEEAIRLDGETSDGRDVTGALMPMVEE